MTQTIVRPLDPELLALAADINAVGGDRRVPAFPHPDHAQRAADIRALAGHWGFVAVYRSLSTPHRMALEITDGRHPVYAAVGRFEAHALPVGMGSGLFVKYVGGGPDAR